MNTLEVGGTAPFMRRKGTDLSSGSASAYIAAMMESLIERAAYPPTKAGRQWAMWSWDDDRGSSVLVDLAATGATSIDPGVLPFLTRHHLTLRYLPADLADTFADIDSLKDLKAGWNGYDVAAPRIEAIHDATEWIERMYEEVVRSKMPWVRPHVSADEGGDVTFEWWNSDKGLTIYVSAHDGVSYLKDWGPDMVDDMEDGPVSTPEERRDIWAWFVRQ